MRSIAWLVIGVVGFVLAYSTREDQTYSHLRLIGCVLLAVGSVGLLPKYPTRQPDPSEPGLIRVGEGDDMTVEHDGLRGAPVTVHEHDFQRDVLSMLTHDHREVAALFEQLDALPSGDTARRDLVNRVTIELVRHSVAEEVYLHPTVRRVLRGGNRLADMEMNEHADAEELLKILQGLDVSEVAFDITLGQLMAEMHDHMRDEEEILFPKLRRAALRDELIELGRNLDEARKRSPAHQHA